MAVAGGVVAGMLVGAYRMGAGWFVFSTFQVLANVDTHPAADRLLVNFVRDAFARLP